MSDAARAAPREDAVLSWLRATPFRFGEIFGDRRGDGFALCHRDDFQRTDLEEHTTPEMASELARYDDAGGYRPLKTAPNLRRGWSLLLPGIAETRLALELFYPGRIAAYGAWKNGTLRTAALRETLARQTGMYRVAAKIGDEEADQLIAAFCRSDGGCLRTILWKRDAAGVPASRRLPPDKFDPAVDQTGRREPTLPLLCQEACNLLVAEARNAVKVTE